MSLRAVVTSPLLTLAILVAGSVPALAQSEGVVRGTVAATADGSPLARAHVTLTAVGTGGPARDGSADEDGRFILQRVPPGDYVLTVTADGFARRDVRVFVGARETRTVAVTLDLARVEASEEVVAEAAPLSTTRSPSSTFLTGARFEQMPAGQLTNLPDAIVTMSPGMIRGHDDFVHVRGQEMALNTVVDGVTFWENPHALFSGSLSPLVVASASVMTGAFPAEYGNRFGGVVDIVTRSGMNMDDQGSAEIMAGQAGRRSVAGEFGGHRNRVGFFGFGSTSHSDRFLSPPDPEAVHDSGHTVHGFGQIDANLANGSALRVILMGDGATFDLPVTPQDREVRPLALPSQRTRQQTAIAAWSRAWSNMALTTSVYQRWSRTRLLPAEGPLTARARLTRDLATLGAKVDLTRFSGRHTVKVGLDAVRLAPTEDLFYDYSGYRELAHELDLAHIHIADNQIAYDGSTSGGQVSAWLQDTIQVSNRMTADVGLRVDHHALAIRATHASPRASVAVDVGAGTVVHASYDHFFVPPPVEGVLSNDAGLTVRLTEIGTALPPVQPTVENQVELGATREAGPLRIGVTGYYRLSDNPVHTTVWPDSRIYSYASFDRARAYGLETKVELPGLARYGMTGYANYALGRVYFYNPVTGGFVTDADHLTETNRFLAPMDQTHTFTGGLTYRHGPSGLWVGTALEYGSGTPIGHGDEHDHGDAAAADDHAAADEAAMRVPGHFTANVSAGVDLWRQHDRTLALQLDIENLTDNLYLVAQDSEFTPGQYSIPRLVSITAKLRF